MSAAAEPVVVGIDGGGSKTLLAVAFRDGTVALLRKDAGTNPFDSPHWRAVLERLAAGARSYAPGVCHVACALPGFGEVVATTAVQRAAVAGLGLGPYTVLNDVEAAFEAAFAGQPGVLLLAGTGSMVWARSRAGRDVRVGGWGEAFGDEGSAFWIGRSLVARVSHTLDGRRAESALKDALFRHLGLDETDPQSALTSWYLGRTHPRSEVAALAAFVDQRGRAGDAAALAILEAAARELALHVEAGWRAISRRDGTGERRPDVPDGGVRIWSYAGGAFRSALLRERVTACLGVAPRDPILPPIGGALHLAATKAGWNTGGPWLDRLKASLAGRLDSNLV